MGKKLDTAELLRFFFVGGNTKPNEDGEGIGYGACAPDIGLKGVAPSAKEIGDPFGQFVVVRRPAVEHTGDQGGYWNIGGARDTDSLGSLRIRERGSGNASLGQVAESNDVVERRHGGRAAIAEEVAPEQCSLGERIEEALHGEVGRAEVDKEVR